MTIQKFTTNGEFPNFVNAVMSKLQALANQVEKSNFERHIIDRNVNC